MDHRKRGKFRFGQVRLPPVRATAVVRGGTQDGLEFLDVDLNRSI